MKIYLAGKITKTDDWRGAILGPHRPGSMVVGSEDWRWHAQKLTIFGEHDYTGPFFMSCDHGCAHGPTSHGVGAGGVDLCGTEPAKREEVIAQVSAELHELTEYLHTLWRANDAKATGELVLKLKVTVNGKTATLVPTIDTKRPKQKVREYPLWVTRGGNLSTDHPTQQRLPLRPVREGSNDTSNDNPTPTPKTKEL